MLVVAVMVAVDVGVVELVMVVVVAVVVVGDVIVVLVVDVVFVVIVDVLVVGGGVMIVVLELFLSVVFEMGCGCDWCVREVGVWVVVGFGVGGLEVWNVLASVWVCRWVLWWWVSEGLVMSG